MTLYVIFLSVLLVIVISGWMFWIDRKIREHTKNRHRHYRKQSDTKKSTPEKTNIIDYSI